MSEGQQLFNQLRAIDQLVKPEDYQSEDGSWDVKCLRQDLGYARQNSNPQYDQDEDYNDDDMDDLEISDIDEESPSSPYSSSDSVSSQSSGSTDSKSDDEQSHSQIPINMQSHPQQTPQHSNSNHNTASTPRPRRASTSSSSSSRRHESNPAARAMAAFSSAFGVADDETSPALGMVLAAPFALVGAVIGAIAADGSIDNPSEEVASLFSSALGTMTASGESHNDEHEEVKQRGRCLWTTEEEDHVREAVVNNDDLSQVATKLGRSVAAVKKRALRIRHEMEPDAKRHKPSTFTPKPATSSKFSTQIVKPLVKPELSSHSSSTIPSPTIPDLPAQVLTETNQEPYSVGPVFSHSQQSSSSQTQFSSLSSFSSSASSGVPKLSADGGLATVGGLTGTQLSSDLSGDDMMSTQFQTNQGQGRENLQSSASILPSVSMPNNRLPFGADMNEQKQSPTEPQNGQMLGQNDRNLKTPGNGVGSNPQVDIILDHQLKSGQKILIVRGNILSLPAEAYVHPTNGDLSLDNNIGLALLEVCGIKLQNKLQRILKNYTTLPVSHVYSMIADKYNLGARCLLHVHSPSWGQDNSEGLLYKAMSNVLMMAEEEGLKSVAIPPLCSERHGFKKETTAAVMVRTILGHFATNTRIQTVYIVLTDQESIDIFCQEINQKKKKRV